MRRRPGHTGRGPTARRRSRREFLATAAGAAAGGALSSRWPGRARAATRAPVLPALPDASLGWHGESSAAAALRAGQVPEVEPQPVAALDPESLAQLAAAIPDLRRRFVFEYYPWWGLDPVRHWDQWDRRPPHDLGVTTMPRLGAYDSRDRSLLETHARWIAESGAGAINLSWWGRGSYEDAAVSTIMDVMHDHDLKVAFHLEPYTNARGEAFVDDVQYILREYGEKRRWDAFLMIPSPTGGVGPVFKGFRMVLPDALVDCHGVLQPIPDYTPDELWARELDELRRRVAGELDGITILADTLDIPRAQWGHFDGIAIYDNFIPPETYAGYAERSSDFGLVFSFNVNPGFDAIEPRQLPADSCHVERPFAPPAPPLDWWSARDREEAASLSLERVRLSFDAAVAVQTDERLLNVQRDFFLVYLNSFNEWHEGHAFEPAQDYAALSAEERMFPYHNPRDGHYRFDALREKLRPVLEAPALRRS